MRKISESFNYLEWFFRFEKTLRAKTIWYYFEHAVCETRVSKARLKYYFCVFLEKAGLLTMGRTHGLGGNLLYDNKQLRSLCAVYLTLKNVQVKGKTQSYEDTTYNSVIEMHLFSVHPEWHRLYLFCQSVFTRKKIFLALPRINRSKVKFHVQIVKTVRS